jgi:ribulose-phosphate 3-epimerase
MTVSSTVHPPSIAGAGSTRKGFAAVYASLLSCDVGRLAEQVAELEASGCVAGIHVDVMDGRFVPNLAFGPQSVKAISIRTKLPIEVHFMVQDPAHLLPIFYDAGAARLIVHAEACPQLHRDLCEIQRLGAQAGVAVNPGTAVSSIGCVLDEIEELLLMGVNPGFGGQAFIGAVERKITDARAMIDRAGASTRINIDGGVKPENARKLISLGADLLVVGSALFEPPSIADCAERFNTLLVHNGP